MSTFPCVACPRRSTQARSLPANSERRREWLLRLNLLDEELAALEEKCNRLIEEKKRPRLCHAHFASKNDEFPIDCRVIREPPPNLRREVGKREHTRAELLGMAGDVDEPMVDQPSICPSPKQRPSCSFAPSQEGTHTAGTSAVRSPPDAVNFLVDKNCLLSLFSRCTVCGSDQIAEGSFVSRVVPHGTAGTALVLQWFCLVCNRTVEWATQPMPPPGNL